MVQLITQPNDQTTIYRDRTWEQFKLIQKGLDGSPGVKIGYYKGVIEILMPGLSHEVFKKIIATLIEAFFIDKNIKVTPTGSVSQELEGEVSAQADESYCIGDVKPIPDLSIEVVFTSGNVSKLQRYQALGVPEVWFWQDGVFRLYRLRADRYEQIYRSEIPELVTLDFELLSRCVLMGETDWLGAVKTFRENI